MEGIRTTISTKYIILLQIKQSVLSVRQILNVDVVPITYYEPLNVQNRICKLCKISKIQSQIYFSYSYVGTFCNYFYP